MLFYKLTDNFDIPSEEILESITKIIDTSTPNLENPPMPLGKDAGQIWQQYSYPKNIFFLRNWKEISLQKLIIEKLKNLQDTIRDQSVRNDFIDIFLKMQFYPANAIPVKVTGAVDPHIDITRKYAITIGLKNSSNYKTFVSYEKNLSKFTTTEEMSYTVKDNDVYITQVDCLHSVQPINDPLNRFTISYVVK